MYYSELVVKGFLSGLKGFKLRKFNFCLIETLNNDCRKFIL